MASATAPAPPPYRQSYIEKDRCVRNSTAIQVPGVDVMHNFTMSKQEFENVFLRTVDSMDNNPSSAQPSAQASATTAASAPQSGPPSRPMRFPARARKARETRQARADTSQPAPSPHGPAASSAEPRPFRAPPTKTAAPDFASPDAAAEYADSCRKQAAALQRATPADYDSAGEFFEKAVDARARFGLFCSPPNADAHVEYAQNLSKRGLTPEAEYHLRTAADIYRILNARGARKYGDVLLYMAVVIDRQGRLPEAENFYRSALAVYRANKLSDDNVRVAIDSLSNNLTAQGRQEEVDVVVRRHFLGSLD